MTRTLASVALVAVAACGSSGSGRPTPPPARTCAAPVRESVLPSDMIQDLGTLQVGANASFVVSPGTASFLIFSQEVANSAADAVPVTDSGQTFAVPNAVIPTNVRAPDDAVYYDDLDPWPAVTIGDFAYPDTTGLLGFSPGFQPVSSGFPVPGTSAALATVGGAGGVQPGTWRFTVNDWAWQCPFGPEACMGTGDSSGWYRVHVVTRPGTLDPAGTGTLDVEVYLATDAASVLPDASAAEAHPKIDRWKRSLGHYLGKGGVSLGAVRFHDVPAVPKERYAPNGTVDVTDSSPCGDLQQLFTTATVASRAVHVFLADEIQADTGGGQLAIVGVDGSIPGPSGFPGTIHGGAIVGLTDLEFEIGGACSGSGPPDLARCGADSLAYITAHEIGHWLGLFHTTEQHGTLFDPLADTARCPCHACALPGTQRDACSEVPGSSGTTLVLNARCVAASPECGGGDNLMFWLLDPGRSAGALTREQGQLMRLNPAVR